MTSSWKEVRLGDLLLPACEPIVLRDDEKYKQLTVAMNGRGVRLRQVVSGHEVKTKNQYIARAGQFIYSRIDARHGAMGIVPAELDESIVTGDFPLFTFNINIVDPKFFIYLTSRESFTELCRNPSRGVTNRKRLKEDQLLALRVSVPCLSEQQRIVRRIEEFFARIHTARSLRYEVTEQADTLFGAAAGDLLGKRAQDPIRPIADIADVRGGIQKGPHRQAGDNPVRYLTVAHVQRNRIVTDDERFFEVTPKELDRWRLLDGDVLIIEGNGSADQIGRTAIFHGEIKDCVHQNHVIRIRCNSEQVFPEYLNLWLNSPMGQREMETLSRTTTGLRTLSVGKIKQIAVPLPSLPEQLELVDNLHAIQTKIDALKRRQLAAAAELETLLPAILDQAFTGRL